MKKDHIVLGISEGHNASACLIKNGKIAAAISEERLSRNKNDFGYPRRAVEKVLQISGCKPVDINRVALGARFMHGPEFYKDWNWYRKGYSQQVNDAENEQYRRKYFLEERLPYRREVVKKHLGVSDEVIDIVEHHEAHAAAAYYACPWINEDGKVLVLTLDGSGDGLCSTVNIGEKGVISRIAATKSDASIGKVYSRLTFLLGMKPWEHEYKIMGLAPYADEKGVARSYNVMKPLVEIDDGELVFKRGSHISPGYSYPYLKSELENHRFDWIAGAAQRVLEELITKWVRNAARATGIKRIACAGGVFMNVKVNMLVMEMDEIDDMFVFPSCGDESLGIGSAYKTYADHLLQSNDKFEMDVFDSAYLGNGFTREEIDSGIKSMDLAGKYNVKSFEDINEAAAELLASGEIVARFSGNMEWGARALGNRSILLDPRRVDKVKELNSAIKRRDFWMPFAPTILAERQSDYIENPNNVKSPHMMKAFHSTERGQKDIPAALHPYDGTCRPQILEKRANPEYYDLIKKFESLTGVGGLLNTSFNLHGDPIVCTPQDAVSTLERSGLEILILGNYIVSKKPIHVKAQARKEEMAGR